MRAAKARGGLAALLAFALFVSACATPRKAIGGGMAFIGGVGVAAEVRVIARCSRVGCDDAKRSVDYAIGGVALIILGVGLALRFTKGSTPAPPSPPPSPAPVTTPQIEEEGPFEPPI